MVDFSQDASDFFAALSSGGDALATLAVKADALEVAATDDQDVGVAQLAQKFARVAGPRGLQRARDTGDANEMMLVQRGIKGVTSDVSDLLEDDVIERFVMMDLGVLLVGPFGLVAGGGAEEQIQAAKNAAADLPLPPAPQDLPWPAFIGGGAVVGGLVALVNTGNPKAALGGAVGGGLVGALVKVGLQKLGDKFSLFGTKT